MPVSVRAEHPPPFLVGELLDPFEGEALLAGRLPQDATGVRVGLGDLRGGHREGGEGGEGGVQISGWELGVELLVEPAFEAEGHHAVHVAGAGAEGEAAEQVRGGLALGQPGLGVGQRVEGGGPGRQPEQARGHRQRGGRP